MRPHLLTGFITLVFTTSVALAGERRPNVLFVVSDDQQVDTIHAVNNPRVITPNLDRLAHRGVFFHNAYYMGGACMPSRAMLMSGRTIFNLDRLGRTIPPSDVTLPEVLRKAGYETVLTGKQHNGPGFVVRGFEHGWNFHFGHYGYYYYKQHKDLKNGRIVPAAIQYPESKLKHTDEAYTDGMLNFLTHRDKSRPFFAYVAYFQPHDPMEVPKRFRDMYPADGVDLPPNFAVDYKPGMLSADDVRRMLVTKRGGGKNLSYVHWHPLIKKQMREHLATYYAMITHMDYQLGRILECLKEQGELENTIIAFTADNGLDLGRHGTLHKQTLYDSSMHVPLILAGPGIPRNQQRDTLCYSASIYPTLCNLLELSVPETVEFKSLTPTFNDPSYAVERTVYFYAHPDCARAVYDGRYSLLEGNVRAGQFPWRRNVPPQRETCLYDRQTDPWQTNNLATLREYQGRLKQLRDRMVQERDRYNDTRPFWKTMEFGQ